MHIEPKVRGFICTTAHPAGCRAQVEAQIREVVSAGAISGGPRRALIIGASTGYGLASRICAAWGCRAATIGVFLEKPGTPQRTGTAGWYNTAAFTAAAQRDGLEAINLNADAFSDACRERVIALLRERGWQLDLVVYSLAAPARRLPGSGTLVRSALKPIGAPYTSTAIDTAHDSIGEVTLQPASEEEIAGTVQVMGGQDWELWMTALGQAGCLAPGCRSVAYSYIGSSVTWPIYWHGTLGRAKADLERAARSIHEQLRPGGGEARVAVLKSVVTQASAAIPVMPLYISICFRIMREQGVYESVIAHIQRLFRDMLYGGRPELDEEGRLRADRWELRAEVQEACARLWPQITTASLHELTDYDDYRRQFLQLFGFEVPDVDYAAEADPVADCPQITLQ